MFEEKDDYEKSSILGLNIDKLSSMDTETLRNVFMEKVKKIGDYEKGEQSKLVSELFDSLFYLRSISNDYSEPRIFIDLVSAPGFLEIDYIKDYLYKNIDVKSLSREISFLLNLSSYYRNHTEEENEKVNYVLRSTCNFIELESRKLTLEDVFNDLIISYFDKETLSQFCREYLSTYVGMTRLFDICSPFNRNVLAMMIILSKKVKAEIGHDQEFIKAFMACFRKETFLSFMNEFYDRYVGVDGIEKFLDENNLENSYELNSLINSIINRKYYLSVDEFLEDISVTNRSNEEYIFGDIDDSYDLADFKDGILYSLYGIHLNQAIKLINSYGVFYDELDKDVKEEDRVILGVLKAIKGVVELDVDDTLKISSLQFLYSNQEKDNDKCYSILHLQALFNRMIINTYNKRLLHIDDLKLIDNENGTLIYDSGNCFDIMLTAFTKSNGGGSYDTNLNLKSRWNTSYDSENHGLCCSHICNSNLGVISLETVLLGFDYIPEYSLNKMGVLDIYSHINEYDLREEDPDRNSIFYPRNSNLEEARYGYDEFLIDRFLLKDDDGVIKLQPSYIVFYKFDDNYKNSGFYKRSLKAARDFNVPVIVVDIKKIKDLEKQEIEKLEDKLFETGEVSLLKDIVNRYMANYTGSLIMVGDENINYSEDFSVKGMEVFFDKIFNKLDEVNFDEKSKWISALEEVYFDEERKFKKAKRETGFSYSVQEFGLNRYDIPGRIESLKTGRAYAGNKRKSSTIFVDQDGNIFSKEEEVSELNLYLDDSNSKSIIDIDHSKYVIKVTDLSFRNGIFLNEEEISPELRTIIDLSNKMIKYKGEGKKFQLIEDYSLGYVLDGFLVKRTGYQNKNYSLVENLVVSYFFESDRMIIDDLVCHDLDCDVSFKCSDDFNFLGMIKKSRSYNDFIKENDLSYVTKELNDVVSRITELDNVEFLKIFNPVIEKYSLETGQGYTTIACNLLDKKKNMRQELFSFNMDLGKTDSVKK